MTSAAVGTAGVFTCLTGNDFLSSLRFHLKKENSMAQEFFALALVIGAMFFSSTDFAAETKPKYGPEATLLSASHDFIRKHLAPDYWALSPYYVGQRDEKSCSIASVTMVVNAARAGQKLTSEEELASQGAVLKKVKDEQWDKDLGTTGKGVTLDELGKFTEEALKAYGVKNVSVEVVHVEDNPAGREILHKALMANEKSANDFIIVNFIQGVYTGDADVGHIAPVAAYDAEHKRALVFDPDRQWYEPYWVSEATLMKGMATRDPVSEKNRGYIWVKFKKD
jgi:hypothetical protein